MSVKQKHYISYIAWFVIVLFYLYQYVIRVSPGVMFDDLTHEFHLTAEEFATIGSVYLFTYSILQIPLGVIIDRIGVRSTTIVSILFCIIGIYIFSIVESLRGLQLSRVLIGIGSASAFMCAVKVVADHFPEGKRGVLIGATLTFGTIGALFSAKIITFAISYFINWREMLSHSIVVAIALLILSYLYIPVEKNTYYSSKNNTFNKIFSSIITIICIRYIVIYALLATALYLPLVVFADLWGPTFIKQKFGLSEVEAGNIALQIYLGVAIGSLVLPYFSEKFKILDEVIFTCITIVLGILSYIIYSPSLSLIELNILMVLLGFFCGAEMMCFTGALRYATPKNSGEIIGVLNAFLMAVGAILQQLIGTYLDYQWDGSMNTHGLRQYTHLQFTNSISLLLWVIAGCYIVSILLKSSKLSALKKWISFIKY